MLLMSHNLFLNYFFASGYREASQEYVFLGLSALISWYLETYTYMPDVHADLGGKFFMGPATGQNGCIHKS